MQRKSRCISVNECGRVGGMQSGHPSPPLTLRRRRVYYLRFVLLRAREFQRKAGFALETHARKYVRRLNNGEILYLRLLEFLFQNFVQSLIKFWQKKDRTAGVANERTLR